jgi:hypothetical protein
MSTARRKTPGRKIPIWVRLVTAPVFAAGTFCLVYHFFFWFLWRFLFGEDVWPWPQWSLWVLVVMPSLAALAVVVFALFAKLEKRDTLIAAGIGVLSIFGLFRYAAQVWKLMFQLGFMP